MQTSPPLTPAQKQLVEQNLGLVMIHLKRYVPGLEQPACDREWDDLFQEGCLGLAQAARRFDRERGIPFPAFALPRIHNAVATALRRRFAPAPGRRVPQDVLPKDTAACQVANAPIRDWNDGETETSDTVGQRLRRKYERAVRVAANEAASRISIRGDRSELVRQVVHRRFLIPEREQRAPIREIARTTQSSYGRVSDCCRTITTFVRKQLRRDPEFNVLERIRRQSPLGNHQPLTPEHEAELARACSDEFILRLRTGNRPYVGETLNRLLERVPLGTEKFIRDVVPRLSPMAREELLTQGIGFDESPAAPDKAQSQPQKRSRGASKAAVLGPSPRTASRSDASRNTQPPEPVAANSAPDAICSPADMSSIGK